MGNAEQGISLRLLVVDDKPEECKPFLSVLRSDKSPFVIEYADEAKSADEAYDKLSKKPYNLIILDINFGPEAERAGLQILKKIRESESYGKCPVVVLTNVADGDCQEDFIQEGVDGFLTKTHDAAAIRLPSITHVILKSLRMGEIRRELGTDEQKWVNKGMFRKQEGNDKRSAISIVGVSPVMRKTFHKLIMVAAEIPRDHPGPSVLITGETGTGKSTFARAIWALSTRRSMSFQELVVNTIAPTLLESALFGHEKGAFTGAYERTPGRFEQANNGVMFLDEIGEMPLEVQVKLLQVLREQRMRPVGGNVDIELNVQLICATNQSLGTLIRQKRFRADLYHRIRGMEITVPTLRERFLGCPNELDLMIEWEFESLKKQGREFTFGFTKDAKELLLSHKWPGNYAEFRNLLSELSMLSCSIIDRRMIESRLLNPEFFFEGGREVSEYGYVYGIANYHEATKEFQTSYLQYWLAQNNGHTEKTARQLGVDAATIYRKLKEKDRLSDGEGQPS